MSVRIKSTPNYATFTAGAAGVLTEVIVFADKVEIESRDSVGYIVFGDAADGLMDGGVVADAAAGLETYDPADVDAIRLPLTEPFVLSCVNSKGSRQQMRFFIFCAKTIGPAEPVNPETGGPYETYAAGTFRVIAQNLK